MKKLLAIALFMIIGIGIFAGNIIRVGFEDSGFQKISDALIKAQSGDTIFLAKKIYSEDDIRIDKSIKIIGNGAILKSSIAIENIDKSGNIIDKNYGIIIESLTIESETGITSCGSDVKLLNLNIYTKTYGINFFDFGNSKAFIDIENKSISLNEYNTEITKRNIWIENCHIKGNYDFEEVEKRAKEIKLYREKTIIDYENSETSEISTESIFNKFTEEKPKETLGIGILTKGNINIIYNEIENFTSGIFYIDLQILKVISNILINGNTFKYCNDGLNIQNLLFPFEKNKDEQILISSNKFSHNFETGICIDFNINSIIEDNYFSSNYKDLNINILDEDTPSNINFIKKDIKGAFLSINGKNNIFNENNKIDFVDYLPKNFIKK